MDEDTPLEFYVASAFANRAKAKQVIDTLQAYCAMFCTRDWTEETFDDYENRRKEICMADFEGAMDASVFILLLPAERGAMTEFGVALGHGAEVIVWGENEQAFIGADGYENIFFSHDNVQRSIMPFEDFITMLKREGLTRFEI